mmetsp:Transcript_32708/g.52177  ORF Transcript_32708/g.52177 Transcript_32708/m.52177 type:complete len:82 (+) Transcript_32708:121-366(+)
MCVCMVAGGLISIGVDPHVIQQNKLLERICNSVDRLSTVVDDINDSLEESIKYQKDIDKVGTIWKNYETKICLYTEKNQVE